VQYNYNQIFSDVAHLRIMINGKYLITVEVKNIGNYFYSM